MARYVLRIAAVVTLATGLGLVACGGGSATPAQAPGATAADAKAFVEKADADLLDLSRRLSQAQWVSSNFITTDTEAISADTYQQFIAATMKMAKDAARYDGVQVDADTKRRLELFKLASIPLPAPSNPAKQDELTKLAAGLEADYGRGKYCPPGKPCQDINALEQDDGDEPQPGRAARRLARLARHRAADEADVTSASWRSATRARTELGFEDLGALWRSGYDMHAGRLRGRGRSAVDAGQAALRRAPRPRATIARSRSTARAWCRPTARSRPTCSATCGRSSGATSTTWSGVPSRGPAYDLTKLLAAKKIDAKGMVQYGERFFTSLGFEPLPPTFWERSLFTKPRDRDVVCHASAWDVDQDQDLRIKMCIEITGEDFVTIHHELGHNFYQRAYRTLPFLFRNSANDGFHEAIGDAIALSVTPDYLVKVGLLDKAPGADGDLEYLMRMALDKVAFLPFGLLVDQWRWKVFSGEITPDSYNTAWWELRRKYQGVGEPEPRRGRRDFDPGAKYHVPANTPYTRYFLAHILQFQFHRAMCREAGYTGPLHRCSIYGNKQVGRQARRRCWRWARAGRGRTRSKR